MDLYLPYGDATMPLTVPDERLLGVLAAADTEAADEERLLRKAVEGADGFRGLESFATPGKSLLVLVNDGSRPTPTARMLDSLWAEIKAARPTFLVATGTHRPPTDEELGHIFGSRWPEVREQVFIHDSLDPGQLVCAGTTSSGNEVLLNRRVTDAERILVLGSVEPHYFAGFTGGRKIFLPGVAAYETIERNHRLAMEPGAEALRREGNPVDAEMQDALELLADREMFAVLAVLDRERRIHSAHAGDIESAFARATADVRRLYSATIHRRADIVVAAATHPLDLDLYQAQKAVENGSLALREGGTLILVSACRDGVGNDAFLRIMSEAGTPERVMALAAKDYQLGYHKAARLAGLARRVALRAVVGVEEKTARAVFMEPFATVQDALDAALSEQPDAGVYILMDAGTTVPIFEDRN